MNQKRNLYTQKKGKSKSPTQTLRLIDEGANAEKDPPYIPSNIRNSPSGTPDSRGTPGSEPRCSHFLLL